MITALLFATFVRSLPGETISFKVDGLTRTALVFRPSKSTKGKLPVYFVFHGLGGNADKASKQFHIQDLDPSALVIYGQGATTGAIGGKRRPGPASAGRGASGWQIAPGQNGDRDIHFVSELLTWADKNGADASRRYIIGHSNGSGFAWVVLKEIGDKFTRFVGMNGGTRLPLTGSPKKPAFLITGTTDRVVSPSSVRTFAEKLAEYNGCGDGSGSPVKTFSGSSPVYLYEYDGGHMPPDDAYEKAVRFCQTKRV
jgi:polyhydroxybutyrate depolymerase